MTDEIIDIAIVDDHTLFRNGIVSLLSEFKTLRVLFQAKNGEDLITQIKRNKEPQVILVDINMPVMDGYACTRWLKENYPQISVLALSMFEDDNAVIKMIQSGASGYVLKESQPRELFEAITTVREKGVYINEMVSGKMLRVIGRGINAPSVTNKEKEFLRLCCSELTYKEIADKMFVSPRTIDNYRESLFQKLEIKTRTGLVLYAIRNDYFKP